MKKIFIDMDGVLAEYRENCTELELMQKGYFSSLKPEENMLKALEMLVDNGDRLGYKVCVLSKVYPSLFRYSVSEKYEWKDEFMPYLYDSEFLLVNGEEQEKSEAIEEMLGSKINEDCILIDDYNHNLNNWSINGGKAVKFLNGINDKQKSFVGNRISYDMTAIEIFNEIIKIAFPTPTPRIAA